MKEIPFKWLLIVCSCAYFLLFVYVQLQREDLIAIKMETSRLEASSDSELKDLFFLSESAKSTISKKRTDSKGKPEFLFIVQSDSGNETFYGEEVLTVGNISLQERMTCNYDKAAPPRLIYAYQGTLGGCPEWNCKQVYTLNNVSEVDALVLRSYESLVETYNLFDTNWRRSDQYIVFYSQESPYHTYVSPKHTFYNMTLGFRHDSPVASPYGYTVKLAERSRLSISSLNLKLISGKTLGAAWFATNCFAGSRREEYVRLLEKLYPVDRYGSCDGMGCAKGGSCEKMLDTHYHFYLSFENSICKDYITEKLWKHGYMHYVVPIVLKRSIVEPYVPPYSFIAVDDFDTVAELANYLHHLTANKTAYLEYFKWRLDYRVVFLDGERHDGLERPWGLCQLCRLIWESPKKQYVIENITTHWEETCAFDLPRNITPNFGVTLRNLHIP